MHTYILKTFSMYAISFIGSYFTIKQLGTLIYKNYGPNQLKYFKISSFILISLISLYILTFNLYIALGLSGGWSNGVRSIKK